jgi:FtsZ-binding cell division protein ZapB
MMQMNANGNLGIGTTTPANKLDVEGSLAIGASYSGTTAAPTNGAIIQGNVGIGTTAPSYKLDVQGGDINASGNVCSAGVPLLSDQLFKTNIDTIASALTVIDALHPKTYYFDTLNFNGEGKFNFESVKQYGFIAQEVETIMPELISYRTKAAITDSLGNIITDSYTYRALHYVSLIPILTKGIQELSSANNQLQSAQNETNAQITQLQQQVDQLEANQAAQQEQIQQLIEVVNSCCNNSSGSFRMPGNGTESDLVRNTDVILSNAQSIVLEQNVPNPFAEQTSIGYFVPESATKAQMHFYNAQGKLIQSVELPTIGNGSLNVFAHDLSNGTYTYSLVVDGKVMVTKKMVRAK